jgi:uncharacterized Zn finger protein
MKPKSQTRFDVAALRDLAGGKVFARGEQYYRAGQAQILALEPARVLATVAGSEDYRTEVTGRGKRIDGACSCPAFEDFGFCKHMVAVALTANDAGDDGEGQGGGALRRIRGHLKEKSFDALVNLIMGIVERDPALFRKLDLAASAMHADEKTLEAGLAKAIDGATRIGDYVGYDEASGWAAEVQETLDAVAELASGARVGVALRLAERAIERIEEAMERIDDSNGECGALLGRARDIHIAAACASRPEPVQLADDLFEREMDDAYETFHGAAALYADALGEAGLAEYRRLAMQAWEKLPTRSGPNPKRDSFFGDYYRLTNILDFFAERDGDVDARIALRSKNLSTSWLSLQLAEFCLSQGRDEEALRRAEEGLWLFEDEPPDERLTLFTADLLSKAGRKDEAEAHLRRAFDKTPSLNLYENLRAIVGVTARESAIRLLESRLAIENSMRRVQLIELFVRILMHEGMYDAAWAAARKYAAPIGLREDLASKSKEKYPREALETYGERVRQLAQTGGHSAYSEAVKLIARMAPLRSGPEQAAYVTALKEEFARKRNFVKLLG